MNYPLKNKNSFNLVAFLILIFSITSLSAQIVGSSSYIKGTSVEIGINGSGGFEGVDMTQSPPPIGMHPRTSTTYFGFVANPQLNAWATFDGDFFTPGSPENGWGVQFGNTSSGAGASNNCSGGAFGGSNIVEIPGTITNYSQILDCISSDWEGDLINTSTNLHFKINYFLQQNDLFYTTTISITNNTNAIIPLLYYYRNLDPDNNVEQSGDFSTTNTIENQPGSSSCDLACVSATQSLPSNSYLALAGVGSDFRVSYGGFDNRSGVNIWNAGGNLVGTQNASATHDKAISLAYKIQNFLPGTTRTFKFVVILKASDKNKALSNLLYLSYPGSQNFIPSSCSATIDTIKACGGSTNIEMAGPNVGDYSWGWTPNTFLSSSTSYSASVTPTTAIVYTITGTPLNSCASPTPLTYTISVVPLPALPTTINSNSPICIGSTLSFTATGGAYYSWTGPNNFTSSLQSPSFVATSTLSSGIYTALVTSSNGCSATTTINIQVSPIAVVSITSATTICEGNSIQLTASGTSNYTWFDNSTSPTIIVTPTATTVYSVSGNNGSGGCSSTAQTTVTTISNATADFSGINSTTYYIGQSLELLNTSSNFTSFKWTLCDGTTSLNSSLLIPLLTSQECCIKLTATNNNCKDSVTKCFKVIPEFSISIPNVFTPNGDNVNDLFKITSTGLKNLSCTIFNRWGTKVYEWDGVNGYWDGKTKTGHASAGTYFYIITYTDSENKTTSEKGFLNLFKD